MFGPQRPHTYLNAVVCLKSLSKEVRGRQITGTYWPVYTPELMTSIFQLETLSQNIKLTVIKHPTLTSGFHMRATAFTHAHNGQTYMYDSDI